MKRWRFLTLVAVLVLLSGSGPTHGFGSATHVYIAQHALFTVSSNALYGSMAPDIIGSLPADYAALLDLNHSYFNLVPKAVTLPERLFAVGWMTHNERWGADWFAHLKEGGYAWTKGDALLGSLASLPIGSSILELPNARLLGHLAVEVAVDVLLAERDPLLGMKVYAAADLRSRSIPGFLYQSGAIPIRRLATRGEAEFREFTKQYGMALALSSPGHLDALAEFVSQAAQLQYDAPPEFTPAVTAQILELAIHECEADHLPVINEAIRHIQFHVWSGNF